MKGRGLRALAVACVLVCVVPAVAWAGAHPVLTGAVQSSTDLSGTTSVAVSGQYAYTTAYQAGELTAVNISTPGAPAIAGHSPSEPGLIGGSNVAISGGYAFVVSKNRNASGTSNDDGNGNSLTILDIHTDPANPSFVGTVQDANKLFGSYGIAVSGHYAFVAYQGVLSGQPTTPDTSTGGFSVIDFSTPGSPTIVANIDNGSLPAPWTGQNLFDHSTSVAVSGNYAYVTAFYSNRFTVIDITDPTHPTIVSSIQDNANLNSAVDVAVQGSYAYVADQTGGTSPQLTVVDISNPANPRVAAALSGPPINGNNPLNGAYRIRVRGDFAYLAASGAGAIGAIDISQPTAPRFADFVYSDGPTINPNYLHKTTGLDLDPTGAYVVASSPYIYGQSNTTYPPYPLQSGGPTATGSISMIQLDPSPIAVTIAPGSEPGNPTTATSGSFTFSVNDNVSAVQCSLDGSAFAPCTSSTTQSYSGLTPGPHTFTVEAIDTTGHAVTASYAWTINAPPSLGNPGPSIAGIARTGQTLTASPGTWGGYPAPTYAYQWQRCSSGGGCAAISGATASTYSPGAPDIGHALLVTVAATNSSGSASANSSATAPVTDAPANGSPPSISGKALVGSKLQASNGTWSGYPAPALSDSWLRCNASGAACAPIGGASSSTYKVSGADIGQTIRVAVRASNSAGSTSSNSPATGVVPPGASGTLTGAGAGKPLLKLALTAGGQGAVLSQVTVSLPAGLSFASQKAVLHALNVRNGSGQRVAYKAALHNGSLVITLHKAAGAIVVTLTHAGLHESAALKTKIHRHRVATLSFPMVIKERTGQPSHESVAIRPT